MTDRSDAIPARPLPLSSKAPGKAVLFGEHAVVHGAPELVVAIDLETQALVRSADRTSLNGDPEALRNQPYFREALERSWPSGAPLEVRSVSRIPRSAGLGSSAAWVAALAASLHAATGGIERAALAQSSFEIERAAQGVGSPGDTAAAVAGGYVALNDPGGEPLWTVVAGETRWSVRRVEDPGWVWVVAYSGIPRSTADAVRSVGRRLEAPDGPALLAEFASVARAGVRAVEHGDRRETAELLTRNHELLKTVGVSHPRLEALLAAAAPCAEGGKLTGAGSGGSVVILPTPGREAELVRRLAREGGVPYVVRASENGAQLV